MDVRGFQVTQAGVQEGAGNGPSFLPQSECALSDEMAPRRPQTVAAGAVCNAGTLGSPGRR